MLYSMIQYFPIERKGLGRAFSPGLAAMRGPRNWLLRGEFGRANAVYPAQPSDRRKKLCQAQPSVL